MNKKNHNNFAFSVLTLLLVLSDTSSGADKTAAQTADTSKPTNVEIETWRQKILHTPQPRKGCFTATYPEPVWREVLCSTEPTKVKLPKGGGGMRTANVGNGVDFVAGATSGISQAEGSFDSVTGVTSESQTYMGTVTPNGYGLQLNSNFFTTSACSASPTPASCQGWVQFLFSAWGSAGIQYWLLDYGPAGTVCPAPRHSSPDPNMQCDNQYSYTDGWCESQNVNSMGQPVGPVSCVANGMGIHALPSTVTTPLDITNVHQVKLMGRTAGVAGSTTDAAIVTYGSSVFTAPGGTFIPDLSTRWQEAEFNIVGSCCGIQAVFNTGSTMVVRLALTSGAALPPTCRVGGFTGETNNLTLVELLPPVAHTGTPSLVFKQSNVAGSVQTTCAGAVSVGDTHLMTFDGLYYDFQASGDFVLVQDGSDFVVQARQASGAPTWPDAAVNKAVATKMGNTRVAIYIEPTRLVVDGADTILADGQSIRRPTGVQISRQGNVYSVADETGNRMRATLNPTWINVDVGLGRTPNPRVRGLLGNPGGNGQELLTANEVVLKTPVLFRDLYQTYADSWRVQPKESLFTGGTEIKFGVPTKPFYAADLNRKISARALAACKAAGVKNPTLLEACTLDTTVLNDKTAVKAFVGAPAPRHVIKPILHRGKQDRDSK